MNIRYPLYEGVYRILTINISNLDINRVLTKKEHNEIRRGIQHT